MPASTWTSIVSRWPGCRGCWRRTYSPRVIPLDGGFAGLFQLDFANRLFARNYEDPVLVSCTDGVGTKLKVAVRGRQSQHGGHRPGGHERQRRPLLRGRAAVLSRLRGHAQGRSGPAGADRRGHHRRLHPGRLRPAGRRDGHPARPLRPRRLRPGRLLRRRGRRGARSSTAGDRARRRGARLASTGLHSNGYSLARKIAFDIAGHKVDGPRRGAWHDGGRGPAHAHADLRPARAAGVDATTA